MIFRHLGCGWVGYVQAYPLEASTNAPMVTLSLIAHLAVPVPRYFFVKILQEASESFFSEVIFEVFPYQKFLSLYLNFEIIFGNSGVEVVNFEGRDHNLSFRVFYTGDVETGLKAHSAVYQEYLRLEQRIVKVSVIGVNHSFDIFYFYVDAHFAGVVGHSEIFRIALF